MSDIYGDSVYEQGGADPVGDTDDLDPIESLTGDDPDEVMQTGYNPPDREPYTLRHPPRNAGETESLDERLAEEEPDLDADDAIDDVAQARAGRLVAPDEGSHADEEKDEVATDVGPAGYGSSAEEAAVHIIDEDDL